MFHKRFFELVDILTFAENAIRFILQFVPISRHNMVRLDPLDLDILSFSSAIKTMTFYEVYLTLSYDADKVNK